MEVEPLQIIFENYEDNERRIEKMYIKNSDPQLKDMHVEFKLYDTKKIKLNPSSFILAPEEIKEIIVELIPCEITSRLELQDFMFVSSNNGEFEKRLSILIHPKSMQRFDTNSSRYHLEPEIQKTSMRNSQLQERALHQILEEKDRLIQRLEEKIQRNELYYTKIENLLRNNSNYKEIQILVNQIRERDQRDQEYKDRQFQNALKQKDLIIQQQENEIHNLNDNISILNQQNQEIKEKLIILQTQDIQGQRISTRQIQSFEDNIEKTKMKYEQKIENYRNEIESLKLLINDEKKKNQQILLQTELLQNDKGYLEDQFQEIEQRYFDAKKESEALLDKLHQTKLNVANAERNRIKELESQNEQLIMNQMNMNTEEQQLIAKIKKQNEELTKKYNHLQKVLEENEKEKLEEIIKEQNKKKEEIKEETQPEQNLTPIVQDVDEKQQTQRYKEKYELKRDKYKQLKSEMVKMYEELKQVTQENIEYNQKLHNLNQQLNQTTQQLHHIQGQNKDNVNSRIAMIEKIKDRFQDQLKESQDKYQQDLQLKQDQLDNLQNEIDRKNKEIQKLQNNISDKDEDINSLKLQILESKEKTSKKSNAKNVNPVDELNKKIKSMNQIIEQKDTKIEELQKEIKDIKSEKEDFEKTAKKKIQAADKKIQEIETQKKEFEHQILNESDNNKSTLLYETTLKQLRIENKELERKYFEEVENYKIIQSQSIEKEQYYTQEIDNLVRKIKEQQKLLESTSENKYETIKGQKVSRNITVLQEELIIAREQLRELSLQSKEISESAIQLEKQLYEITQKYDESQQTLQKYKDIEEELEIMKRRSQREQQYKNQINEEIEQLKEYIHEVQKQKDNIMVQMKLKDEAIQESKEYQNDLINFMKEIEQKYNDLNNQNAGQSYDMNSQIQFYVQQVDLLTFENKRYLEKNNTINQDLSNQLKENKDLKAALIKEEQKSKMIQAQLDQYDKTKKKQMTTLRSQLQELKLQNDILYQEKMDLIQKIEEMHQNLIDSEQIYFAHLSLVKTKFEKEYKEFIEAVNIKIKFFIAKKDQIDMKTKMTQLFEKYLENIPLISEKEAKIKSLSNRILILKDQLNEKQNENNPNGNNNGNNGNGKNNNPKPTFKYSLETIIENAKIIIQKQDIEKLIQEMQQYKQLSDQKTEENDNLMKQNLDKDEKIKSQLQLIKQIKADMLVEKEKYDKLQSEKDAMAKEIKQLQNQIKQKNISIDQKSEEIKQIARLKEYNEQLKEDNTKKEEQINKSTQQIQKLNDNISKLNKQIQEIERKEEYVKDMQDKYNKMKEEATQIVLESKKLQEQNNSLKNDITRKELLLQDRHLMEDKYLKLKQVYDKLKDTNNKNKDNIKKLNATIRVKDQINQNLKSQVFDDDNNNLSDDEDESNNNNINNSKNNNNVNKSQNQNSNSKQKSPHKFGRALSQFYQE